MVSIRKNRCKKENFISTLINVVLNHKLEAIFQEASTGFIVSIEGQSSPGGVKKRISSFT